MTFLVIDSTRHWLSILNLFLKKHESGRLSVPGLHVLIKFDWIFTYVKDLYYILS